MLQMIGVFIALWFCWGLFTVLEMQHFYLQYQIKNSLKKVGADS